MRDQLLVCLSIYLSVFFACEVSSVSWCAESVAKGSRIGGWGMAYAGLGMEFDMCGIRVSRQ